MNKRKKLIWAIIAIVAIGLVVGAVFLGGQYADIRKDFARLESETYDTVFFSMYPTDNYVEEDYAYFRAMQMVRCDYEIPNGKVMRWYMDKVNASGNMVTTVYLGVDPEKTTKEDIVIMIQENPEIKFEIVPVHPQINYWLDMSEAKCEKVLAEYQLFLEWMIGLPNAGTYFFTGQEWLVCNPNNYEAYGMTNAAVSQFLMCNSDNAHAYMLRPETIVPEMDELRDLIDRYRKQPIEYPNASDYDIVFFGDSIIGSYTDSMSIPEVVAALTGANVYNCGYGGKSAALGEFDNCPVSMIVNALVTGDLSELPKDHEIYDRVSSFYHREKKSDKLMFVVNYGINDYFRGYPVESEDDYDITSFSGAVRTAVKQLQEAFPEATIMLNTPNMVMYFEYGELPQSERGGKQSDYAEAVIRLAQELNVEVLDNYRELPSIKGNWEKYLSDGCHLNEQGRFLVGSRIAQRIK